MVETDAGDDRDQGLANIGTVEPPAEADFDYRCVGLLIGKMQEGHGRDDFEICGTDLA